MSTPPVIYDTLRLLLAAGQPNPRGIDRVDLAYAQYLFGAWDGDCFGMLPTPWGVRLYGRAQVQAGLRRIADLWREGLPVGEDVRFRDVLNFLGSGNAVQGPQRSSAPRAGLRRLSGPADVLMHTGITLGHQVASSAPPDALYINVGQLGWASGIATRWLSRRPDIRPVFLLHDVIPIDHPELVSRLGRWSHAKMLRVVDRHARGVICTTEAATRRVRATVNHRNNAPPLMRALHLPVAPAFLSPQPSAAPVAAHPYFVVCGAIEPRKNHALLIAAWDRLVRTLGTAAPRLVVAGSPGVGGGAVLRALNDAAALTSHVMVVSGLHTPALRQLVAGARAALMPSWAEGFGLPVIEALTLGTPVIASDLPAHREVGGSFATYLPPDDPNAWAAEIAGRTDDFAKRDTRIAAYHPVDEATYFADVRAFLLEVANARSR